MPPCNKTIYQKASWRGIPFDCQTSDDTYGMNGAVHSFLGNDDPFAETTVRKPRSYSISGIINGDGHLDVLRDLVKASEEKGSGSFIHPIWGNLTLKLDSMSASVEEEAGGGVVNLTFDFVEAGSFALASDKFIALPEMRDSTSFLRTGLGDYFSSVYSLSGQTQFISDRTLSFVSSVAASISGQMQGAVIWSQDAIEWLDYLYKVAENPRLLTDIFGFLDSANEIRDSSKSVELSIGAMQSLMTIGRGSVVYPDQTGENLNAVMTCTRVFVAHSAIYSAIEEPEYFNSFSDSLDLLDSVLRVYDEELEIASNSGRHELYRLITDVKSLAIKSVYSLADILPARIVIDACGFNPSLVAAHNVYGDAGRAIDLEMANPSRTCWAMNNSLEIVK